MQTMFYTLSVGGSGSSPEIIVHRRRHKVTLLSHFTQLNKFRI